MQQLLMDNILPIAPRRKPISIQYLLKQTNIENLFKYYQDALFDIYKYYTTTSDLKIKGKNMLKSTTTSTFDDQKEQIEEAKQRMLREYQMHNNSSNRLDYNDFFRFAHDFGIMSE